MYEIKSICYVVESYINGQKKQADSILTSLYRLRAEDLAMQVLEASEMFGMEVTMKILLKLGMSPKRIINAYHDYQREDIDEVKYIVKLNTLIDYGLV